MLAIQRIHGIGYYVRAMCFEGETAKPSAKPKHTQLEPMVAAVMSSEPSDNETREDAKQRHEKGRSIDIQA